MEELKYNIEFERWCRDNDEKERLNSNWNRIKTYLTSLIINIIRKDDCK